MIKLIKNLYKKSSIKRAFSDKKRQHLYNNLAMCSKASIPINESIRSYAGLYTKQNEKIGYYLNSVANDLDMGKSLLHSFSGLLPSDELAIINAGSRDANMQTQSFRDCAYLVKRMSRVNREFKKTAFKSMFKFIAIVLFVIVVAGTVKGVFSSLDIKQLPWFTKALQNFSVHISFYWPAYAVGAVLLLCLLVYRIPKGTGKLRSWLQYRVFPFTIYRKKMATSFLMSLGSLVNNSFSRVDAIDTLRKSADEYMMYYLNIMHHSASLGKSASSVFDVDLFDTFTRVNLIMLLTNDDTGSDIKDLADEEITNTEEEFENINSRIDSFMLILMAVIILWAGAGFMIPILEQTSNAMSNSTIN